MTPEALPAFGWGGTGSAMNDDQFASSLFDQALPFAETFGTSAKSGVLTSLGLGTGIRKLALPAAAPTAPAEVLDRGEGQTPQIVPSADYANERAGGGANANDTLDGVRAETPQELSARRETAGAIDEETYKASPYFRTDIPWAPTMTRERAKVQAEFRDAQKAREFFMEKRPITSFFGTLAGGAVDPSNYIPIAGPAVRAAAIARAGRTIGTAIVMAGEAAVTQGALGAATSGERAQFGDDTSWQAQVTDIAMGALTGGLVGGLAGRVASHFEMKADTLRNQMKARAALDDAVRGLAEDGEVKLTPTSAGFVDDANAERARLSQAYDRVRSDLEQGAVGDANDPLVRLTPSELEATAIARGGIGESGEMDFGAGFGLVKFIVKHGEMSTKPETERVTRQDVVDFADVIRSYDPVKAPAKGDRRNWAVQKDDGRVVVYGDRAFPTDGGERRVVTIHVNRDKNIPLSPRRETGSPARLQRPGGDTNADLSVGDRVAGDIRTTPLAESSTPVGGRERDTGAGLSIGNRAVGQEASTSVRERPAPTDITSPKAEIDPVRMQQAARAEATVAKPETSNTFAKDVGFHPETGESVVSPLVKQIEAEGRLDADAVAEIKAAHEGIDDASAFSEALRVATGCII